jgi:hypothetical protein
VGLEQVTVNRSGDLGEHLVPINGDAGHRSERCFPFEVETGRAPVTSRFNAVDCQCAIEGVYEPYFAEAGALVNRDFTEPVVSGGTR